ncbi:hypothetical protein HZB02_01400 [Candidatus Woesearchaeota archaeon]|nr:hypothetical protein [Candidatus Woesearchaeota archaeon]
MNLEGLLGFTAGGYNRYARGKADAFLKRIDPAATNNGQRIGTLLAALNTMVTAGRGQSLEDVLRTGHGFTRAHTSLSWALPTEFLYGVSSSWISSPVEREVLDGIQKVYTHYVATGGTHIAATNPTKNIRVTTVGDLIGPHISKQARATVYQVAVDLGIVDTGATPYIPGSGVLPSQIRRTGERNLGVTSFSWDPKLSRLQNFVGNLSISREYSEILFTAGCFAGIGLGAVAGKGALYGLSHAGYALTKRAGFKAASVGLKNAAQRARERQGPYAGRGWELAHTALNLLYLGDSIHTATTHLGLTSELSYSDAAAQTWHNTLDPALYNITQRSWSLPSLPSLPWPLGHSGGGSPTPTPIPTPTPLGGSTTPTHTPTPTPIPTPTPLGGSTTPTHTPTPTPIHGSGHHGGHGGTHHHSGSNHSGSHPVYHPHHPDNYFNDLLASGGKGRLCLDAKQELQAASLSGTNFNFQLAVDLDHNGRIDSNEFFTSAAYAGKGVDMTSLDSRLRGIDFTDKRLNGWIAAVNDKGEYLASQTFGKIIWSKDLCDSGVGHVAPVVPHTHPPVVHPHGPTDYSSDAGVVYPTLESKEHPLAPVAPAFTLKDCIQHEDLFSSGSSSVPKFCVGDPVHIDLDSFIKSDYTGSAGHFAKAFTWDINSDGTPDLFLHTTTDGLTQHAWIDGTIPANTSCVEASFPLTYQFPKGDGITFEDTFNLHLQFSHAPTFDIPSKVLNEHDVFDLSSYIHDADSDPVTVSLGTLPDLSTYGITSASSVFSLEGTNLHIGEIPTSISHITLPLHLSDGTCSTDTNLNLDLLNVPKYTYQFVDLGRDFNHDGHNEFAAIFNQEGVYPVGVHNPYEGTIQGEIKGMFDTTPVKKGWDFTFDQGARNNHDGFYNEFPNLSSKPITDYHASGMVTEDQIPQVLQNWNTVHPDQTFNLDQTGANTHLFSHDLPFRGIKGVTATDSFGDVKVYLPDSMRKDIDYTINYHPTSLYHYKCVDILGHKPKLDEIELLFKNGSEMRHGVGAR